MAELIACVNGDPGVERPQDLPLMGMCITICPECGKQCMIDFQFDVARYLELLKDSFPENYQSKEEVEDNDFFENLEGALSNLAIADRWTSPAWPDRTGALKMAPCFYLTRVPGRRRDGNLIQPNRPRN